MGRQGPRRQSLPYVVPSPRHYMSLGLSPSAREKSARRPMIALPKPDSIFLFLGYRNAMITDWKLKRVRLGT